MEGMRTSLRASFLAAASAAMACSSAPSLEPSPATAAPIPIAPAMPQASASASFSPLTNLVVSSGALVPPFDASVTDYEVSSLTRLEPVTITPVGQDVTIDGAPAAVGVPHATAIAALDDATVITVTAKDALGAELAYRIHTAPAGRPTYTATSSSPLPGLVALSPFRNATFATDPGWLYLLDETGALVFYRRLEHPAFDFKRHALANGTARWTYMTWNGQPRLYGQNPSTVHVLDEHMQELRAFELLPSGGRGAGPADVHDVMLLGDDHWVALAYVPETVTNVPELGSANVVGCVVQEVKNDAVVFDWDTTSFPELYADSSDGDAFANTAVYSDYAHLNSVDVDPSNGNFVLSFRHLDEVIEVDRGTGAIVWKLGGKGDQFGLAAGDKTSHQHDARFIAPGRVLLFDNGNATLTTRVREYQIDPVAHTASVLAAERVDAHYTMAMGSAQKLSGRYFIGWGLRRTGEADVTELDPQSMQKSFELSLSGDWISYRARKLQ